VRRWEHPASTARQTSSARTLSDSNRTAEPSGKVTWSAPNTSTARCAIVPPHGNSSAKHPRQERLRYLLTLP
jgi:hypothetical protein